MATALEPMDGFTFGCDPELFVTDPDGRFVSAEGLIPGTKSEPFPVKDGAIQVDGMAAEFNIDPVTSFEEFNRKIVSVIKQLQEHLPKGYKLNAVPSAVFSEEVWAASPDKAKELGCTPDFNAWTGDVNPPPFDPDNPRLRTASGHIHIGWTDRASLSDVAHIANCRDLVKQLDWYLGGWSLQQDPDKVRRKLYGKAGAMRYKPYGVEYRVLSNFWLKSAHRRFEVWNRLQQAIWDMRVSFIPDKAEMYDFNTTLITSINESSRNSLLESKFRFPLRTMNTDHQEI